MVGEVLTLACVHTPAWHSTPQILRVLCCCLYRYCDYLYGVVKQNAGRLLQFAEEPVSNPDSAAKFLHPGIKSSATGDSPALKGIRMLSNSRQRVLDPCACCYQKCACRVGPPISGRCIQHIDMDALGHEKLFWCSTA